MIPDKGKSSRPIMLQKNAELQTETLNNILVELKTLNINFQKIEKGLLLSQQHDSPYKNTLIEILNNFDPETILKTLAFLFEVYKREDKNEDEK